MALGIFSSFVPGAGVDVVGVYDKDFVQLFPSARPIKAVVKEDTKVMDHPVETGATITDFRIVLPVEIELSMILPGRAYKDAYQRIKEIRDQATLVSVQTRTGVYGNQLIVGIPHEESPDFFDTVTLSLKLREVQFVTPQSGIVPRKPSNKPTTDKGQQEGKPADEKKQSAAREAFERLRR